MKVVVKSGGNACGRVGTMMPSSWPRIQKSIARRRGVPLHVMRYRPEHLVFRDVHIVEV